MRGTSSTGKGWCRDLSARSCGGWVGGGGRRGQPGPRGGLAGGGGREARGCCPGGGGGVGGGRAERRAGVRVKSVLFAAHLNALRAFMGGCEVKTGLALHARPEGADAEKLLGLFFNAVPIHFRSGAEWSGGGGSGAGRGGAGRGGA